MRQCAQTLRVIQHGPWTPPTLRLAPLFDDSFLVLDAADVEATLAPVTADDGMRDGELVLRSRGSARVLWRQGIDSQRRARAALVTAARSP